MPNWAYLLVTFLYNLSLAVWIGGAIALGAVAAPTLFAQLESRSKAGEVFGAILRKFARLRLVALVVAIVAAMVKYVSWESAGSSQYGVWVGLRWGAMVVMAAAILYETFFLETALARHRAEPAGAAFQRLHRRAGMLMSGSIAAAMVALLLN
jgi:uncharacterized membrane protein